MKLTGIFEKAFFAQRQIKSLTSEKKSEATNSGKNVIVSVRWYITFMYWAITRMPVVENNGDRVMEFPDRAALDAYLASEPYVMEHVWDRVEGETMNVVILDGKM